LTNSKHQHIGAKGAFCGIQNAFPAGGSALDPSPGAQDAPQITYWAGEGTRLLYHTPLDTFVVSILPPLAFATWQLNLGGMPADIFLYNRNWGAIFKKILRQS